MRNRTMCPPNRPATRATAPASLVDHENRRTFGVLDDGERRQLHRLLLRVAEVAAGPS